MGSAARQPERTAAPPGRSARVPAFALAALVAVAGVVLPNSARAQECPPWRDGGEQTGRIQSEEISESSGLAASRRHDGRFWTHNDSGNSNRIFLYRSDGVVAATGHILGAAAKDWEDMAIGPCSATSGPGNTEQCIYLADIGDNKEKRETVEILKFPEPDLPDQRPASIPIDEWDRIEFEYEQGPRDAETVMVHPETAKIYVIQKNNSVEAPVFRVPNRSTSDSKPHSAKKFTELRIARGLGRQVTGGDISPDGREFSIRTYVKVYTYCADSDESFESAFSASPVISQPRLTIQSEGVAYDSEDDYLWFTSEGKEPPMVRMKRAPAGTEGAERGELEEPKPTSKQAERDDETGGN